MRILANFLKSLFSHFYPPEGTQEFASWWRGSSRGNRGYKCRGMRGLWTAAKGGPGRQRGVSRAELQTLPGRSLGQRAEEARSQQAAFLP